MAEYNRQLNSTPIGQECGISTRNMFHTLQQWTECEQTPISSGSKRLLSNTDPKSVSDRLCNTSFQLMDDKLTEICAKLEKLDKNDEKLLIMSTKMNFTSRRVDRIDINIDRHATYMKQLAYHSIDLEARSRRNNLIIYGLADTPRENTYVVLAEWIWDYFGLDLDAMCVQRVHRLGSIVKARSVTQTPRRPIICAFRDYKDTECIMSRAQVLSGTSYGIDRDYPKEIAQARKYLWNFKKQQRYTSRDKVAINYPAKLIVNGAVVKDVFSDWHSVLNMDRLSFFRSDETTRDSIYSQATEIDSSKQRDLSNNSQMSVGSVSTEAPLSPVLIPAPVVHAPARGVDTGERRSAHTIDNTTFSATTNSMNGEMQTTHHTKSVTGQPAGLLNRDFPPLPRRDETSRGISNDTSGARTTPSEDDPGRNHPSDDGIRPQLGNHDAR